MLTIPNYIEEAAVVGAPIRYKWDDDDLPTFYTESDRIQSTIAKTTTAGAVALALGCLEWVAWRLSAQSDISLLLHALEAMWAGIVDARYVRSLHDSPMALKHTDWHGAKDGAVYVAYMQLRDLQTCVDDKEPASPEASCAVRMARFVLPSPKQFDSWWRLVLKRVVDSHPDREEGDQDIGKPIPREALDPSIVYHRRDDTRYLSAFIKRLDPASNPFLASPREMKRGGFTGKPYEM
jgi:hypothetical protein